MSLKYMHSMDNSFIVFKAVLAKLQIPVGNLILKKLTSDRSLIYDF